MSRSGRQTARAAATTLLLVMATPLVAGRSALGQGQPAAVEALISEGVELRKKGADNRALPLFQKAYDLERSPRTAAQLGLAEASLGYWLAAERHLTEALQSTRNPWLSKHEPALRKTLKEVQASIGEVEIIGEPADTELTVNGQAVGKLPLPAAVRVPEGAVQVVARANGHQSDSRNISVQGGKRVVVKISLELMAAPAAEVPVASLPAPAPGPAPAAGTEPPIPTPERRATWVRPTSWFLLAASAGGLGVGGYGLMTQRKRGKEFDNYRTPGTNVMPCGESLPGRGGTRCDTLLKQVKSAEKLAIGGFALGGALAAAAIVGFVVSSPSDDLRPGQPEVAFSLGVGDGRASPLSFGLAGSF